LSLVYHAFFIDASLMELPKVFLYRFAYGFGSSGYHLGVPELLFVGRMAQMTNLN